MAGLYIHIPFCRQACHYCDFHFSTQLGNMEAMVLAMEKEMDLRLEKADARPTLETIYFGGGTPSVLPQPLLSRLFRKLEKSFDLSHCTEITLEANPDDGGKEQIRFWKSLGINRLSIGIQSLNEERLRWMNRLHDAQTAIRMVKTAQDMELDNLSLDLMYQFPDSTISELQSDLEAITGLEPRHISAYGLTIEEKTVFGHRKAKGLLQPLEDEWAANQFSLVRETLQSKGFIQYEISNFGQEGFFSQHNSSYWFQKPFWGIGPGAHGFDGKDRYANISNNPLYIKSLLENGKLAETREILSMESLANEIILTRLRTMWGLNLEELKEKTGFDLGSLKKELLEEWQKKQLMIREKLEIIQLSPPGQLLADYLAMQLMVEEEN